VCVRAPCVQWNTQLDGTRRYNVTTLAGCVLLYNNALEKAHATGKPHSEIDWRKLLSSLASAQ
jgi:hypothetical protein